MPDDGEILAAVEAGFLRSLRRTAGALAEVPGGWSLESRDLPLVWTLNQVRIVGRTTTDDLVTLAEACQGDLPYRHVVVRNPHTVEAVEASLHARGWRVEHDVVMVLTTRGAPDAHVTQDTNDARIVELREDQMLELMAAWLVEDTEVSDEGLAQVLEYNRREGAAFGEQRLGVVDPDGVGVAVTKLRIDGAFGWVEDVYTLPRARRNGHARMLVGRAVDLALDAGCEIVAIVADADDWPQHLYEAVGFRPIGRASIYHREVGEDPRAPR